MTGGHGEWFVERFDAAGVSLGASASLRPEAAVAIADSLVAGNQAQALVALRGSGEAAAILPDARALGLLGPERFVDPHLIYGRAPDARLPDSTSR